MLCRFKVEADGSSSFSDLCYPAFIRDVGRKGIGSYYVIFDKCVLSIDVQCRPLVNDASATWLIDKRYNDDNCRDFYVLQVATCNTVRLLVDCPFEVEVEVTGYISKGQWSDGTPIRVSSAESSKKEARARFDGALIPAIPYVATPTQAQWNALIAKVADAAPATTAAPDASTYEPYYDLDEGD